MTRDERPAPTVFHHGVIVPAELLAELATELEHRARDRRRTGQPGLPRAVAAVLKASRDAAAQLELDRHRQAASWAPPTVSRTEVLASAQLGSVSEAEEWISTAEAASLAGCSGEWARRLAKSGTVRARRGERGTWQLLRSDVVRYTRRPLETRRDHHRDRPA